MLAPRFFAIFALAEAQKDISDKSIVRFWGFIGRNWAVSPFAEVVFCAKVYVIEENETI